MPGENCSVYGCNTDRKIKGIGIFKLPSVKLHNDTRKMWIHEITKKRVMDANFKNQLSEDTIHVCEKHFKKEDIIQSK